jgi:phosphatidylethanolamine-binding protein (PEBP) family uncharacterized protein
VIATTILVCHVIVSGGLNGNWHEKLDHEMAHCNGWVHPEQEAPLAGAHYQAYTPPRQYVHHYHGRVILEHVSIEEAKRRCDGHYACQWFEGQP